MKVSNEVKYVFSRDEVVKMFMTAAGIRDDTGVTIDIEIPEKVTLVYFKESEEPVRAPQTKRSSL